VLRRRTLFIIKELGRARWAIKCECLSRRWSFVYLPEMLVIGPGDEPINIQPNHHSTSIGRDFCFQLFYPVKTKERLLLFGLAQKKCYSSRFLDSEPSFCNNLTSFYFAINLYKGMRFMVDFICRNSRF